MDPACRDPGPHEDDDLVSGVSSRHRAQPGLDKCRRRAHYRLRRHAAAHGGRLRPNRRPRVGRRGHLTSSPPPRRTCSAGGSTRRVPQACCSSSGRTGPSGPSSSTGHPTPEIRNEPAPKGPTSSTSLGASSRGLVDWHGPDDQHRLGGGLGQPAATFVRSPHHPRPASLSFGPAGRSLQQQGDIGRRRAQARPGPHQPLESPKSVRVDAGQLGQVESQGLPFSAGTRTNSSTSAVLSRPWRAWSALAARTRPDRIAPAA